MIPFCKPIVPDFRNLETLLKDSIKSGHLSNFGKLYYRATDLLTDKLQLHGDRKVVITSSGHTALMAAYAVLDVKRLVVPSYTFEATRSAATLQGIEVQLVDVDADSGCLSVEVLKNLPIGSYDAVVAVAALSSIPDLMALSLFCQVNNKKLIVDGAPTYGTDGIYNYGDAFCLSFHATKTLSVGEAGAVIMRSSDAEAAKQYITFGFDDKKKVQREGINGKVSEYTCAILIDLLCKVDPFVDRRLRNLARYKKHLGSFIPYSYMERTCYCSLPLVLKHFDESARCLMELNKAKVQALRYYKPLDINFKVSTNLYERNVCLPIHHGLSYKDIDFICGIILDNVY